MLFQALIESSTKAYNAKLFSYRLKMNQFIVFKFNAFYMFAQFKLLKFILTFIMKSPQLTLKQAVEQQLQLILKMEEDRKLLKKENKNLNEKYQKLTEAFKKYNVIKIDQATLTIQQEQMVQKQIVQFCEKGCQVELLQQNNMNLSNTSRLVEAQSLLKGLDSTINFNLTNSNIQASKIQQKSSNIQASKIQQKSMAMFQNQTLNQKILQNQEYKVAGKCTTNQKSVKTSSANLSLQIVKMSKQISNLKRQLKQSQHRSKLQQKQFKQTKKCLQNKGIALQKCRKQFNELSLIYNTDKLKSVRNLQTQCDKLRIRAIKSQEQEKTIAQLKTMLCQVTNQYQQYRQEKERKIYSLVRELKDRTLDPTE